MKRTHVMHKRDNRSAKYLANQGRKTDGPEIEWRRTEDGNQQQLFVGGVLYGTINAHSEPRAAWDKFGQFTHEQEWRAETENGKSAVLPDADQARMFVEREYRPSDSPKT
jgi:hypothetical protein